MDTPLLSISALSLSVSDTLVLQDVSFSLAAGTITLLSGHNGSGKSMLLKSIKGLVQPKSGTIVLEGRDLSHSPRVRNKEVGLVFQDADTQIVGQTVYKDILFGLENLGIDEREQQERCLSVMKLMGLEQKKEQRPRTLSGGEKRRLAIAGILVMKPRLMLLDEPFANLDYPGIQNVLQALLTLKDAGHTLLVVSHDADKLLSHMDHVLIMEKGHIVWDGGPHEAREKLPEMNVYLPTYQGIPLPLEELTCLKP